MTVLYAPYRNNGQLSTYSKNFVNQQLLQN
ncbi:hypothetical protein ACVWWK_008069 [Bradyrhizobium sp. LB9.1b]